MAGQFSDTRNVFPQIESHEDAIKCARSGGKAGYAIAILSLFGAALTYFTQTDIASSAKIGQQTAVYNLIGILITIPFILFMAYRVNSGKGYISGILLIIFMMAEFLLRVFIGGSSIVNVLVTLFVVIGLINGFRGCRALKRMGPEQPSISADIFD